MFRTYDKMRADLLEKIKPDIVLLFIVLFFLVVNLLWFSMDQAPPMWDQAHYLETSEILYHDFTEKGFFSLIQAFTDILKIKAPLITILPVPFYIVFGNTYTSALYVNLLFMILTGYFLYKLGVLISGKKEALLSVFVLNVFPLIIGMSREFLTEYGLMTFVIMWMYYLLRSNSFEKRGISFILGVILGLGMLMKISFIFYIVCPTLLILIRRTRDSQKIESSSFLNLAITVIIGVLIAGPWYFKNLSSVVHFAVASGYGNSASKWGMGELFSVKTILSYWLYLINYGISAYFFFLIIFLFVTRITVSLFHRSERLLERSNFLFLATWFLFPFILFTFGVNKDYRYITPFLPVVSLVISTLIVRMTSMRFGYILLSFLLVFPIFNYLFISFSSKSFHYEIVNFKILDKELAYSHPPIREKWPLEEVVEILRSASSRNRDNYPRISLLFDHNYINFINLNYYAKNRNAKVIFDIHNYFTGKKTDEIAEVIMHQSSYVITKSDKLGPDLSNNENIQNVMSLLDKGKLNFRQIKTIPLPDETTISIYKNTCPIQIL